MIQTTLGALVTAEPALDRLAGAHLLNQKLAYDLAKLVSLVKVEIKQANTQREAIVRTLCDRTDETTGAWTVKPGCGDELTRQLEALAAVPVSIDWHPLSRTQLESEMTVDKQPLRISGADAWALGALLPEHAMD